MGQRLIDADAYKHILKGWLSETYSGRYGSEDEGAAIFRCICQLDDAPTVDAVPVVRCRDCKRWQRHSEVNRDYGDCRRYSSTMRYDDFCSQGERRTDNGKAVDKG